MYILFYICVHLSLSISLYIYFTYQLAAGYLQGGALVAHDCRLASFLDLQSHSWANMFYFWMYSPIIGLIFFILGFIALFLDSYALFLDLQSHSWIHSPILGFIIPFLDLKPHSWIHSPFLDLQLGQSLIIGAKSQILGKLLQLGQTLVVGPYSGACITY